MTQEYKEYLHGLFLKDEISFGQAMNMAVDKVMEEVEQYLKVNLTPFDWCIGHTEYNEIVMNAERFIEELKKHLGYDSV